MSPLRATRSWLLTAGISVVYLLAAPPSADLAAQQYRTDLAKRAGLTVWDNAWYAGHHIPGYSLIFPWLGAILTPQVTGALAATAAAALFGGILSRHWPADAAAVAAWWFAAGVAGMLWTGRLTFALGLAFGLAAVALAQRERRVLAPPAALLTAAASPVAALFLALGAVAWLVADAARRVDAAVLLAASLLPVAFLAVAFPEGGTEPFPPITFWPVVVMLGVLLVVLPREERLLRIGVALYGLACVASYVVDTPMGSNVIRLGALFAGPLLAAALWPARRVLLAVLAVPLLYWQFLAPVRDWLRARDDPAVHAVYYQGLLGFLGAPERGTRPFRVEVPFTRSHWEGRYVAARRPLARGWERQLDIARNGLFYDGRPLTAARYRRWLDELGVRYVALPDATLDHSARAEAALIRRGLPYLRPVWRDAHWRVYEVDGARPIAVGGAQMVRMSSDGFTLQADRPGSDTLVHVHFSPYWGLDGARGCVSRAPGDWTRVRLADAGTARVTARFAPGRILDHGPRCSPGGEDG